MRVIHLTFYKCASQWVRDILTDPEVSLVSGCPLSVGGIDVASDPAWPAFPPASFAGPIYGASYQDWWQVPARMIAPLSSFGIPGTFGLAGLLPWIQPRTVHDDTAAPIADCGRHGSRPRADRNISLTQWADRMRSWGTAQLSHREYLTGYARLVANPKEEFSSICRFLGWDIEPRMLDRVVDRNTFEKRTGRKAGELNPFSHLRKGVNGDWKNYFDRELGEEFETTFPQLLADLGFETNTNWYKLLPATLVPVNVRNSSTASNDETVRNLLSQIASFEDKYTELGLWRSAAEDRLADVTELTQMVGDLQARLAAVDPQTSQHLSQIRELTGTVRSLERAVADHAVNDQRLNSLVDDLRARLREQRCCFPAA